jgi:L-fuculose-phosphate aldolase
VLNASENEQRKSIISHCLLMNRLGINQGTSGNISVRHGEGLLITPTSIPYETLEPEDIVYLSADGTPKGRRQPSSEWRFHRDIMRERTDINAIVHTHPIFCTILAIMERGIPAIHYMIAAAGGPDIRCGPYAIFGSAELSKHAVDALDGRRACLLAHHGMIAIGSSLEKAMWLAVEVETLAKQYHGALQLGEPPLLTKRQIDDVAAKMAGYGNVE